MLCSSNASTKRQREYSSMAVYWKNCFPITWGCKQADRTKFHINLDPLSRMIHLFIGLRDVLWVRRMYSHDPLFPEEMVKTGNGAGVTALAEFDPESDQTGMGISAAHIVDQADLIIRMLVWVVMGSAGAVPQGAPGSAIAAFPAVDILPVGFVFDSSFCDTKFFGVLNQGQTVLHIWCYTSHSRKLLYVIFVVVTKI